MSSIYYDIVYNSQQLIILNINSQYKQNNSTMDT